MGCFEDQCDIATSYPGYSPLALTSDLASFKLEGYLNAETVVIFLQGGQMIVSRMIMSNF